MVLGGCANRVEHADAIASSSGLQRVQVKTNVFLLTAYTKIIDPSKPFNIYIEGDGLAWLSRTMVSPDPTPRKALGLSLAASDPAANVIYIARPCQFTPLELDGNCNKIYWTSRRFSEEVIASVNQAIDKLAGSSEEHKLNLIGYSGGGAVVILLAARRHDVASIRTVAGNLDHAEVNRLHDVTQLSGSLNAIDVAARVASIPQLHFSGDEDTIINPTIAEKFSAASGATGCIHLQVINGASHEDGWLEHWPSLLQEPVVCSVAR